jgi:hypothetical protein
MESFLIVDFAFVGNVKLNILFSSGLVILLSRKLVIPCDGILDVLLDVHENDIPYKYKNVYCLRYYKFILKNLTYSDLFSFIKRNKKQ